MHYFESGIFGSGQAAWHTLGKVTNEVLTADNLLQLGDLDKWNLTKQPIYLNDGTLVPDKFALVRGKDGAIFDVVGKVYTINHNEDSLALIQELMGAGLKFETAISIKGGTVVTLLAHAEPYMVLGDEMKDYMALTNYHIGGSRKAFWTTVRVVCANTQASAEREAGKRVWACRHTKNSLAINEENLKRAREILKLADNRPKKMKKLANDLVAIKVDDASFERMMEKLFDFDPAAHSAMASSTKAEDREEARKLRDAYQEKRSLLWRAARAQDLANFTNTGWGALQAVTAYQSHVTQGVATTSKDVRRARTENRFLEVMENASMERRALDLLFAMA